LFPKESSFENFSVPTKLGARSPPIGIVHKVGEDGARWAFGARRIFEYPEKYGYYNRLPN